MGSYRNVVDPKSLQAFRCQLGPVSESHPLPLGVVVLGSGFRLALGSETLLSQWEVASRFPFASVPGLYPSTVVDHVGEWVLLRQRVGGARVLIQAGRLHGYEGLTPVDVVLPVLLARACGISQFVLTNAAGGLRPDLTAGSVVLISDHVNFTGQTPVYGAIWENPNQPGTPWCERFPDQSGVWSQGLWEKIRKGLVSSGLEQVTSGVYVGVSGPTFETPAEVRMFGSAFGGSAVGMSTVWEAIALNATRATVTGVSLIANSGTGLGSAAQPLHHEAVIQASRRGAESILNSVLSALVT